MSIPGSQTYDLAALQRKLRPWFEIRTADLGPLSDFSITANPNGSGLSNETFIVTATLAGAPAKWALRCAPVEPDKSLFMHYDIPRQFRIMAALQRDGSVPVTPPLWLEESDHVIGTPFFVMDFVSGDVPADNPPWQISGFLVDGTDQDRAKAWWSMIDLIARVGKVDWRTIGLAELADDPNNGSVGASLAYYERCFRSGRVDSPPFPEAERALRWLHANIPADAGNDLRLSWGDTKPGNFIFRNHQPVAIMDWEMASLSQPEMDLANFLIYQFSHENTFDPAHRRPRLPGFGTNRETIARFETLIGRPLRNLDYYWVFAAFRYLALAQRYIEIVAQTGGMSREQAEAAKIIGGSMTEPMLAVMDGRRGPAD